jgi:hypothetical protein
MEPWRSWMRSGFGSLSRILVWSVEGPRGAKLDVSSGLVVVGEAGRDSPLPSPGGVVNNRALGNQIQDESYLPETPPAANLGVSRSPWLRYLIVRRSCALEGYNDDSEWRSVNERNKHMSVKGVSERRGSVDREV